MIQVIYLANSAKLGGGNRVLMDTVIRIDRTRFAPLIVAPGEGPLIEWARRETVPVRVIRRADNGDSTTRVDLLRQAALLARMTTRSRTVILHAMAPTCYHPAGLAGFLTRTARVCHLEFPPGAGEIEWAFRFGPDAVICCYEGQVQEVEARIERASPRSRILAIPNSIDVDHYTPGLTGVPDSASPLRFGARHVVLTVGHLSEVKGYPTLLEAATKVAADVADIAFVALGGETTTPGYRGYLERRASELGIGARVHFLGWRGDVAEVLRAADIMVLPSLAEGLPLAVLEAMACGRAVVATSVNGVPEAVVDGRTGFLVPPRDADALAEAILRLLRDPALARQMGQEGRRRVKERFSLDHFVARIEALYDEILSR